MASPPQHSNEQSIASTTPQPTMKPTYKIAIALALARVLGTPAVAVILLYLDNTNTVLFDCALYWLHRARPLLHLAARYGLVPFGKFLSRYADRYLRHAGYASAADVLESAPIHHVVCFEVVTFTNDLVAFYKRRSSHPQPVRRLCPNGDHGNIEETLIIAREHMQRIAGAAIAAVFLSALLTYSQTLFSFSVDASAGTPVIPIVEYDYVSPSAQSDGFSVYGSPRAYRSPPPTEAHAQAEPTDPPVAVICRPSTDTPPSHIVPGAGMSLAEARQAMRAAHEACAQQSARAFVAAVRKRIQQDNRDVDDSASASASSGGIDTGDRAVEAAIGMSLFGLE